MAFIMSVLPGVSLADMNVMDLPELVRWQDHAIEIHKLKNGKP